MAKTVSYVRFANGISYHHSEFRFWLKANAPVPWSCQCYSCWICDSFSNGRLELASSTWSNNPLPIQRDIQTMYHFLPHFLSSMILTRCIRSTQLVGSMLWMAIAFGDSSTNPLIFPPCLSSLRTFWCTWSSCHSRLPITTQVSFLNF